MLVRQSDVTESGFGRTGGRRILFPPKPVALLQKSPLFGLNLISAIEIEVKVSLSE
jgi:hypothetical protein